MQLHTLSIYESYRLLTCARSRTRGLFAVRYDDEYRCTIIVLLEMCHALTTSDFGKYKVFYLFFPKSSHIIRISVSSSHLKKIGIIIINK